MALESIASVSTYFVSPTTSDIIYSDTYRRDADISTTPVVWEDKDASVEISTNLEQKLGFGYDVLKEVDILQDSLVRNYGRLDRESEAYAVENEYTAACEAVQDSGYLWFNHRQWDPERQEFLAFGTSFLDLLQSGIDDIDRKIAAGKREYLFEKKRRETEYKTEEMIRQAAAAGNLDNGVLLTISAYPEEQTATVAEELGYKPDEQLAKLRFEVFTNGVRQTVELSVANGSVHLFKKLLALNNVDSSDIDSSLSLLGQITQLEAAGDHFQTILQTVAQYDALLEQQNGSLYFCGRKVESVDKKNYHQLLERQQWVREKGEPFINHIHKVNHLLAENLYNDTLDNEIMAMFEYWLTARNGKDHILSEEERTAIQESHSLNKLTREAAFSIKKNELIRMWSIISCVINEERAKELFGEHSVARIQSYVSSETEEFNPLLFTFVDQMASQTQVQFTLCGGSIERSSSPSGLENLFQSPLDRVKNLLFSSKNSLFGNTEGEKWEYKNKGECRVCQKSHEQVGLLGPCNICKKCEKKFD